MEIPNTEPLGGNMDGMGDLDNTPMPPMGSGDMDNDPMGSEDPMGGGQDPMGDPNGGDDPMGDDMGNEPPMDDEPNDDNDELDDVMDSLSVENQAAVLKYAKSMVDDGGDDEQGGEMPMEGFRSMKRIIDETINDVLDGYEGTDRPQKKVPKSYRNLKSPFKSPY